MSSYEDFIDEISRDANNSKGNYIAFLDADDTWSQDKLKDQIFFMLKK